MSIIFDTDEDTTSKLPLLKQQGIVSIGRYLNRRYPQGEKVVKPKEAQAFAANGVKLFLIYEYDGKPRDATTGRLDGAWSLAYAKTIGAPADGSQFIAYTVDYDAPERDMPGIKAAFASFKASLGDAFQVWAYASGAVCDELYDAKLITGRWLTCSRGFRGTAASLAATRYEMRQALPADYDKLDTDPDFLSTHIASGTVGFVPSFAKAA